MELSLLLTAFIASSASGAVVVQRQTPAIPAGLDIQSLLGRAEIAKPVKVEILTSRVNSGAERKLITYGPLTLPPAKDEGASASQGGHSHGDMSSSMTAGNASGIPGLPGANMSSMTMDPNGFAFSWLIPAEGGGLCGDCGVLAGQVDVVYENGSRAEYSNGVYLHHAVTSIVGKKQSSWLPSCPGNQEQAPFPGVPAGAVPPSLGLGAGFLGGAVDDFVDYFTTPDGKFNSSYYIPPSSNVSLSGEIINYLNESQLVYIRIDMEWMAHSTKPDAIKTAISVDGCTMGNQEWYKDKGTINSDEWTVTRNGTIIYQRGHMHDGGVSVTSFWNGEQICNSEATYGQAGGELWLDGKTLATISKMSECTTPVPVKQGDKIKLQAAFDNIAHPLRESHGEAQEDMGFMTFTFVPA